MRGATLRSYKLRHDSGFAPNPFFGTLTLATCKPGIRKSARIGEWIAGFTSQSLCGDPVGGERLIYLMKVGERLTIAEYFGDPRFAAKRPVASDSTEVRRHGDNIYCPLRPDATSPDDFEQVRNPHHWGQAEDREDLGAKQKDLGGVNVLVATEFFYFGWFALLIPPSLRPEMPKGQSQFGYLTHDSDRVQAFVEFVRANSIGRVMGPPHVWPAGDESWRS